MKGGAVDVDGLKQLSKIFFQTRDLCGEKVEQILISIVVLVVLLMPSQATAQYFGRNKVQYENFDFKVLQTEHFNIYYYPEELEAVRDAARMAERWYVRHSKVFNHQFKQRKPIIFYADQAAFQQTNIISGLISEGTGGVTEALRDRVIIPLTGNYAENDHVIGHELVHAFQYDIAQGGGGGILNTNSGMYQLPLWYIEGMAEYLSIGREDPFTSMWMRDAVLFKDIPTVDKLAHDMRYFPYRFGDALWAYIGGMEGDRIIGKLFGSATVDTTPAEPPSQYSGIGGRPGTDTTARRARPDTVYTLRYDSLSRQWADSLRKTYQPQLQGRTQPKDVGKKILAADIDAGNMNLSPALSPDGKYVAFLSERDVFSIELFMADAQTGKIIKSFTSTNTDPHFDALSFVNTAGTWSPDGKKFAFIVYAEGRNEIAILDVDRNSTERRIKFDSIGAIANPAWSPDGKRIAFAGTIGGIQDLYILDLPTGAVRRLTLHDKYAYAQPAWSPDGKSLAFVTDRGGNTNFDLLSYSPLRIGVIEDVDAPAISIKIIAPFDSAQHINPQYSPDGRDLYFVSDRGGFNDIYRMDLATGDIFQVTKVATGITGLTATSPALSVAQQSGRMMFTVFEHRDYNGYSLEPEQTRGERVMETNISLAPAGVLPPVNALGKSLVNRQDHDPETGLTSGSAFTERQFHSDFRLDYIGQAFLGVGADRFGTYLGGGISMFFSDILNNNNLGIAIQSTGTSSFKDIGGEVSYQNLTHRLNWGLGVSHIPYLTASTNLSEGIVNGQVVDVVDQYFQRVYIDQIDFLTQYPLSTTRRWELNAGYTHLGYDLEVESDTLVNGSLVSSNTQSLPSPGGLGIVQASLAYVGDYSFFGFTSPTSGGRYRIEGGVAVGTLDFFTALADYRRYLYFSPFTFAIRAMHYGRYGRDAESSQLTPLFIGYPVFIRGYDASTFDPTECANTDSFGSCPEFDRLLGSRMAIGNIELRLPVFGTERFGLINFPYFPLELVGFFDGGVAWSSGDVVKLKFERNTTDRVPVFSTGVSARVNILGYLVAEVFHVYPFQRPDKGAFFGFQIAPGW